MDEYMQQHTIDCATHTSEKFNIEKDIGEFDKEEFRKSCSA